MKKTALCFALLFAIGVFAQDLYPLKLHVKSRKGKHIWGQLAKTEVNAFCDEPILVGDYRARLEKEHVVIVQVRTPGTENTHEISCKF